jgi:dTDP-4-dehydrorhamnose 3,5-epimerase-like enzyme
MHNKQPEIIHLPKIVDPRGNLTFIEEQNHIPFDIKRVYWIYDVPGGETRGGHAFKQQEELIISLSGSFDIILDNGTDKQKYSLNRSYYGLYVPAGMWRHIENFSTNSLAVVLASTEFDENDYIRDIDDFKEFLNNKTENFVETEREKLVLPEVNSTSATVFDCKLIELDKNHRIKGNITVVENRKQVPFDVKRVYYLYDVPGGEERGGHAHKDLFQLIVAAGGSFDVELNDGNNKRTVTLNRPYQGLYVVPGIWRELVNFSSGSTCLVMASEKYNENDYIREHKEFEDLKME